MKSLVLLKGALFSAAQAAEKEQCEMSHYREMFSAAQAAEKFVRTMRTIGD